MPTWVLVPILATVVWYLASMATITRWLWSRYPDWLDSWATCPACSGTWYSVAVYWILGRPLFDFPARSLAGTVACGLTGTFFVPLLAWALAAALRNVHQEQK